MCLENRDEVVPQQIAFKKKDADHSDIGRHHDLRIVRAAVYFPLHAESSSDVLFFRGIGT